MKPPWAFFFYSAPDRRAGREVPAYEVISSESWPNSSRILKSDLGFEGRTSRAKLDTPGLITDDTVRRYSAPRLERLD